MKTYKIFVAESGVPKTGLSLTWEYLYALDGTDKSASAPTITEVGGGWYKFSVTYGTAPFDVDELVGVIDCSATLGDNERYIPVTLSLRDFAHDRLTNTATYNYSATNPVETIKGDDGADLIKFTLQDATPSAGTETMTPGAPS